MDIIIIFSPIGTKYVLLLNLLLQRVYRFTVSPRFLTPTYNKPILKLIRKDLE